MAAIMPQWRAAKSAKHNEGDATYHYSIPPLANARDAMSSFTGNTDLWSDE
jgi:hypothetical protein